MKVGDLVRLSNNRLGVIMAYYKEYWYVWANGKTEYYQTKHLEFL